MGYLLTNQNNFGHIPYTSSGNPKATVKSGGCGPCAALMVLENMTAIRYKMADWISWVKSTGARVSGGTDMGILAKAMAKKFGFTYTTTSDEEVLKKHLLDGGMAVAHVSGAYSGWPGLFSSDGHFVTVFAYQDGKFVVGDPGYYAGKYSGSWRAARCTVKSNGSETLNKIILVTAANLHADTKNRTPNYYLFKLPKTTTAAPKPKEEEKVEEIEIKVNGVSLPQKGFLKDKLAYAPVRALGEKLSFDINWENDTRMAIMDKVPMTADVEGATIDGILVKGTSFAPIRLIAEALGATVEWDNANNRAIITIGGKES